jgi:hypothetical protein
VRILLLQSRPSPTTLDLTKQDHHKHIIQVRRTNLPISQKHHQAHHEGKVISLTIICRSMRSQQAMSRGGACPSLYRASMTMQASMARSYITCLILSNTTSLRLNRITTIAHGPRSARLLRPLRQPSGHS